MNILVVSDKRTGSYQMCNWLKKELSHLYAFGIESPESEIDYKLIINPFSEKNEKYLNNFHTIENCIVLIYFEDYKNFIKTKDIDLIKYFDFTICFKRKNFREHSESILWYLQNENSTESYFIPDKWIKTYAYEIYKLEKHLHNQYMEMDEILGLHVEYDDFFNEKFKKDLYHIVSYIGFIERYSTDISYNKKYRKYNKLNLI